MSRQPYEPNDAHRELLAKLCIIGVPHEKIAGILGVSLKTLYKYYRAEFDHGLTTANAEVAGSLYMNAIKGNVAAQIFWCKTKLGWKEESTIEHSGGIKIISDKPLSEDEWNKLHGNPNSLGTAGGTTESTD